MKEAWALDPNTNQAWVVTAAQWGTELKKDPTLAQRFQLVTKGTQKPLVYRGPHTRMGHEERVRPHFAYAAGYAPPQSHIFKREPESLEESVRQGKKILLTLNTDLSHVKPDFRKTAVESRLTLERFQHKNEGKYVTYAIHDAAEAVAAIKKIHGLLHTHQPKSKMDDRVFALYRGGVLPYHKFFLGDRREDIAELYEHMKQGISGVVRAETRVIGTPRLLRFVASDSTKQQQGLRGLKGAVYQPEGGDATYFSQLVFADENIKETPAYKALREQILHNKDGVYVLACPTITIGGEENGWRMMRWVINDISAQTAPVGKPNIAPKAGPLYQAVPA